MPSLIRSWWRKKGPGRSKPWSLKLADKVIDYNDEYMKSVRLELGDVAQGKTDEEVLTLINDDDLMKREIAMVSETPWADFQYINDRLSVKDYNPAFIKKLRNTLGDVIDNEMTDEEIIGVYVDRENIEREDPRLDVIHLGIETDGRVKVELDWNQAFINHLKKHGITGETESEAIEAYLSMLSSRAADEVGTEQDVFSREMINEAFSEIDIIANRELDEAESTLKNKRKTKRR